MENDQDLQAEWDAVELRTDQAREEAAKNVGIVKPSEDIASTPINLQEMRQWISQLVVDPEVLRPLREQTVVDASCCGAKQRSRIDVPNLNRKHQAEKDLMVFLHQTPFDFNVTTHFRMLRTIYKKLTRNQVCASIGGHWEVIGFQNTDPRMDLNRSGGVLNVVHLFFFCSKHFELFKAIYVLSIDDRHHFPLACVSTNLSQMVYDALFTGRLSSLFTRSGTTFLETFCSIHSACLYQYYDLYRSRKCTVVDNEAITKEVKGLLLGRSSKLLEMFEEAARKPVQGDLTNLEFTDLELGSTAQQQAKGQKAQNGAVPDRLKGYAAADA